MTRKWRKLSPRSRQLLLSGAAFEAVLKVMALVDLARRPAQEVRGPKWKWAAALLFINSVGLVPVIYLRKGRRASWGGPPHTPSR